MADSEEIKKLNDELDKLEFSLKLIAGSLSERLNNSLVTSNTQAQKLVDSFEKGENITSKIYNELIKNQEKSNKLALNKIKLETDLSKAQSNNNFKAEKSIRIALYQNQLTSNQLDKNDTLLRQLEGIVEEEEKITKEKQKQNSISEILKNNLYKILGTNKANITEMFTLSGIFSLIISKALEFNKTSVELSKNLGYSGEEADRMLYGLAASSVASSNINLNSKAAAEAITQISESTGYVAEFSQDALETQILLTKQFGLTGAEAARIYELSVLTGKSSSQVNDEMVGAFIATRNQLKVGVPFKATIAAAAKVSGQLAANLQNNPALITKAVVQAAALGTTLEETSSQGKKLLDFSSSIENELKAELLTGKQLNLERARAAALAGDQVTLAQELAKNVGSLADFEKMNVLQQEALAEAVGLTADKLAEQLKKQQIAKETGKSIAEQNKEDLLNAQKRQNLQDLFNAAVNKLSDILTVITQGPIGLLIKGLTGILSNAYLLYGVLGTIALIKFSNITNGFKDLGGVKDKLKGLLGGGKDKTTEAATKGAEAGTKVGGSGKAGDGIKNTLKGISSGIASFDKVSPASIAKLALSAVALTLLTPAIPGLLLLQLVNGTLIKGALTGLGQGLTAFGTAMSTGYAALGLAALVASAIGLGYALRLAAPAIEAFGKGIAAIFDSFAKMNISQMLLIGPALASIGIGMIALGSGAVVGSIGALIAVGIISKLAEKGDQLNVTATALQNMATALTQVSSALTGIDVNKLDALDNFASNRSSDSIVGGITDFITAPIKAIGESISGGGEKGNDMTPMITAINEVRAEVAKLANRPIEINLDGKKVGSGLTQGSYKFA